MSHIGLAVALRAALSPRILQDSGSTSASLLLLIELVLNLQACAAHALQDTALWLLLAVALAELRGASTHPPASAALHALPHVHSAGAEL